MLLNSAGGKDEFYLKRKGPFYFRQEAKIIFLSDNFSLDVNSDHFSVFSSRKVNKMNSTQPEI